MTAAALTTSLQSHSANGFSRDAPHSPATIADWQRQLESVIPKTDQLSHLRIEWEPGYPWQPKGRYVLWQMSPIRKKITKFDANGKPHLVDVLAIHEDLYKALAGPSPMSTGHACFDDWCECVMKHKRWVGGPPSSVPGVDLKAWELYQQTGHFGRRWWVIQGENGGHRYALSSDEKRLMRAMANGVDPVVPKICDLPYAPFDNRVLMHVRRYDKLASHKYRRDFGYRTGADVAQDSQEIKEHAARLLMEHLSAQTDMWLREDAKPWLQFANENVRPTDDFQMPDEETVVTNFLRTASL